MSRLAIVVVVVALASGHLRAQPAAARSCADLTALVIPGVTIAAATAVPAGSFLPPGTKRQLTLPAFCRVELVATPSTDSVIKIEVWLPPAGGWNGKLLATGTVGFLGALDYNLMASALARGYATAGTDAGHVGGDLKFAHGHPEKIIDFSYRAIHVMSDAAKIVVRSHAGRFPDYSYFNGCNTGGHQGLSEAQRYPQDFDGIVAGMPANDRINEIAAYLHMWKAARKDGINILPPGKLDLLGQAVMTACDGIDGVRDGVIDDPPSCRFDPRALVCAGAETAACLTADQVSAVDQIYRGARNPRTGEQIFPGWPFGTESWSTASGQTQGWRSIIDLPAPRRSEFWNYFVFNDPNWHWSTMDLDRDLAYAAAKVGYVSAIDPNLAPFKAAGGKLLIYTGWADPILPGGDVIHYYDEVEHAMGGRAETTTFARLFMMPGVGHCSGGPGPDVFDPVTALEQWVEKGQAPERLIASKMAGGKTIRTRPLCPYPQVAKWNGRGSTDDAANFTCGLP